VSQLLFLRHLARSVPRVAAARLRRGPARPSWTFGYEVFASAMKRAATDIAARSWAEQRAAYDALANPMSPIARHVRRSDATLGSVPCEWFMPRSGAEVGDAPVVLYLHGGAYIFGSTRSHGELISRIALAARARVLAPNYRLAPEHPFPAAIDDAVAVYRALVASGIAPSRIVVGGDSAGGGLTAALLLRLRAAGESMPSGAFLVCPWLDLTAKGGSLVDNAAFDWASEEVANGWIEAYLGGASASDPLASPALAELHGLPPILVQVGGAELILDQSTLFARRAKEAGVDVRLVIEPDQVHDWHSFAGVFASCRKPIDEIGAFVREVHARASKVAS